MLKLLVVFSLVFLSYSAVTTPIEALGTVLPQLNPWYISPHRVFNDLMKQSLPLVPYNLSPWGSVGRCWSCTLSTINNLKHQYPSTLPSKVWAVA